MMDKDEEEWGDLSDWLSHIDHEIEGSFPEDLPDDSDPEEDPFFSGLISIVNNWIRRIEDAPTTTWQEELSVRGMDFDYNESMSDSEVAEALWTLIHALAGMRVFLSHTDHLCDRELYATLVAGYLSRPVAQIVFDEHSGCMLDILDLLDPEDERIWLRFYADNADRVSWAESHPDERLPRREDPAFFRDSRLPKP